MEKHESKKRLIKKSIQLDMSEYFDDINEVLCGCKCPICDPYNGDSWGYQLQLDALISNAID
jgi:hypothetical protein